MKKDLYVLLFCVFCGNLFAQSFVTPLCFEDKAGMKDTLWVGMDADATYKTDTAFGETVLLMDSVAKMVETKDTFLTYFCFWNADKRQYSFSRRQIVPPTSLNDYLETCQIQLLFPVDRLPVTVSWNPDGFDAPYRYRSFITDWVTGWFDVGCGIVRWAYMADTSILVIPYQSWEERVDCRPGICKIGEREMHSIAFAFATQENFKTNMEETTVDRQTVISPNPVAEALTIHTDKAVEQITISTLTGQMIYSIPFTSNTIEVSFLPNGYYLLALKFAEGVLYKPFIKQ